jgi:hypothetical protein
MRRKTKACTKRPVIPRADVRRSTGEESYHLQDTMASESYKLQINNSCVTSITGKSTMEWQGVKHALKCLILYFDGSIKNFAWTSKRPCAQQSSTKLHVKRFHLQRLAGPIDSKQHTPIKSIGLLLDKAVKIKGINPMIIPFE